MTIINRRILGLGMLASVTLPTLARGRKAIPSFNNKLWHIDTEPTRAGMAPGPNGPIHYRIYGKPGGAPLIVLHGGPAAGETYMRPYVGLATDRQVVLYDQTGCGRSARPADLTTYTPDSYVSELESLRDHLGFERVSLLGHGWGGSLASLYATAYPEHVVSLVLAGSAPATRDLAEAAKRWLEELGPSAVTAIARNRSDPNQARTAYADVMREYDHRHLLRLEPWPVFFNEYCQLLANNRVYKYLIGPNDFRYTGKLARFDISRELKKIAVPALVTCGEFDEAPEWVGAKIVALMHRAELKVFKNAAHMAHIEQPAGVIAATGQFLRRV